MRQILGYTLVAIPFLCVLFIGFILPSLEWWVGFLTYGIATIAVGLIYIGMKLIND